MHQLVAPIVACPTPRGNGAYDGLATGVDVDVLDCDALLTLAAVTIAGFGLRRVATKALLEHAGGAGNRCQGKPSEAAMVEATRVANRP